MRTNYTARTKYTNTPESDLLEEVMHIVNYMKDGVKQTVEVMAKEPSDAINKIMNGEIENDLGKNELDRKIQTNKNSRCNRTE